MARVNVLRFDEEEFVDLEDGTPDLQFRGARLIARSDSVESAVKLLGISGMRAVDTKRHPVVGQSLRNACAMYGIRHPVTFLRGVHGTFVIARTPSPKRAPEASEGATFAREVL